MKKTCDNCKALKYNFSCDLNYINTPIYWNGIGSEKISATPKQECPKPLTLNRYIIEKRKQTFKL
jgi:hypothetical protein